MFENFKKRRELNKRIKRLKYKNFKKWENLDNQDKIILWEAGKRNCNILRPNGYGDFETDKAVGTFRSDLIYRLCKEYRPKVNRKYRKQL